MAARKATKTKRARKRDVAESVDALVSSSASKLMDTVRAHFGSHGQILPIGVLCIDRDGDGVAIPPRMQMVSVEPIVRAGNPLNIVLGGIAAAAGAAGAAGVIAAFAHVDERGPLAMVLTETRRRGQELWTALIDPTKARAEALAPFVKAHTVSGLPSLLPSRDPALN
jgi:hypothetical protein